jgi:hypothetical protein
MPLTSHEGAASALIRLPTTAVMGVSVRGGHIAYVHGGDLG